MPRPIPYQTAAGLRYEIRYRDPDHTERRKRGFKTKRDANEFYASVAVAMKRGEYIDPQSGRLLISELGEGWLARKRHLKPSSYRVLESTWRNYVEPKWGKRQIVSILRTEVQAWVTNLATGEEPGYPQRSATVIIRAHEILRGILADAVGDKRLSANPAEDISLPRKGQKPKVYLSHEQVRELADAAKYPTVVRVLAYCGLRWGEMAALRVMDVDHARRRLKVTLNAVEVAGSIVVGTPKTHRGREVPFPRFMADALKAACAGKTPEDLLFPGPNGDHLRNARVHADNRSWFASALKASGTPRITPHDLRHTAAGFAVSAGANVKVVQRMLGHKTAAMTLDVYADLFDSDLDSVADALDLAVAHASGSL